MAPHRGLMDNGQMAAVRPGRAWIAWQLWRHFGPAWLLRRVGYQLGLRIGALARRSPASTWAEQTLRGHLADPRLADPESYLDYRRTRAPAFFFAPSDRTALGPVLAAYDQDPAYATHEADGVLAGEFPLFSHHRVVLGFPPDWHVNPLSGVRLSAERHWSQIGDFAQGDIKAVWETSRFSFAFALVRAYWRTGDDQYAQAFWQLVDDWRGHNPPGRGPQWKCGQEASLRAMAWCFGLYGTLDSPAATAQRVASLAEMLAYTAMRVEANLSYAVRQQNNHGLSEALGLWTIGSLFPEFRRAEHWRELGRRTLEQLVGQLFDEEGGFSQHSFNYQRLTLDDLTWVVRLAELHGAPFSDELKGRAAKSAQLLYQVQDETTGRVPRFGQNDGALVLPVSNCPYEDFRPVVQATLAVTEGRRVYAPGPWDEALVWLLGPAGTSLPLDPPQRRDLAAPQAGCHTLRTERGFAFVRCGRHRHRPGQADMLHVDLWWRGLNIALDPGTFSYNAPPPWNNPLAHTAYHNAVTVDGRDQMERVGRFLWLPWVQGKAAPVRSSALGRLRYWQGEHDGYQRLADPVRCRRGILRLGEEHWLVIDRLEGRSPHRFCLHWLLEDFPAVVNQWAHSVELETPQGRYQVQLWTADQHGEFFFLAADPHSPRGWQARYYQSRQRALSLALLASGNRATFASLLGPAPAWLEQEGQQLVIRHADWAARVLLADESGKSEEALLAWAEIDGPQSDRLDRLGD